MSTCALKAFEDIRLRGWLPGLQVSDDGININPAVFPCCGSSGIRENGNEVITCSVRSRLIRLQKLLSRFERVKQTSVRTLQQRSQVLGLDPLIKTMQDLFKAPRTAGWVLKRSEEVESPGLMWILAAACIWRFNADVHVCSIRMHQDEELVPKIQDSSRPTVLFVEDIGRLWDPDMLQRLEFIISWCYSRDVYLWGEFLEHKQQSTPKKSGTKMRGGGFRNVSHAKRLQESKLVPVLERMSADSRSKFKEMMLNWRTLEPQKRKTLQRNFQSLSEH